jgi:phage gp45-like
MIRQIDARIRRHMSGIRLAFRGVVTLAKAAGAVQLVQFDGLSGEKLQDAELFQQFGFTSNLPKGTMGIVLPIGGKTAHGIIIATEHGSYRLKTLASGEAAIYNQWGDYVALKADRRMEVVSSTAVDITSPEVNMSGNLNVAGDIIAQGDISDHDNKSMASMRMVYNGHTQIDSMSGIVQAPGAKM